MQAAESRDCCRGSFPLPPHAVVLALLSISPCPPQVLGRLQGTETLGSVEVRELKRGQAVGKDGVWHYVQTKSITWHNTQVFYSRCPPFMRDHMGCPYSSHQSSYSATIRCKHWRSSWALKYRSIGRAWGKRFGFFSLTERLITLHRSHALWATHTKSPFSEPRRKTLQDRNDLAPVFLGNRFAYKICIRGFRAIRSLDLWSFFCSIRYRAYLHSTRRFFLQFLDSRPL